MAKSRYQVGDKVKFLNQVGGGVVTKVTDDFVFVQDDSGFDIPMQETELIRMADMSGAGKMFNDKELLGKSLPSAPAPKPAATRPPDPDDELKQLRSQVANLKELVARLRKQLATLQKQGAKTVVDNVLLQHTTAPGEAEVDLHIDMLAEQPALLTAHEAFELQMRYFRTCMNHAIANRYKRVVFIHGVGRGVLKDEILKELKQYDGLHFFDAAMSKYGVGATEVYLGNDAGRAV